MKTRILMWLTLSAFIAVSCTDNGTETPQKSVKVEPAVMTFAAVSAQSQEAVVTAVGVEWNVEVPQIAQDWLTAVKEGDDKVVVSVADNPAAEERVGSVAIVVSGDESVRNKEITVTQAGNESPEAYSLTLSAKRLDFEAAGSEAQDVTVTVEGEGMTWKATADDAWVTVSETDDGFSVSVTDNTDTEERIGTVTVTPSEKSVEPVELVVYQKAGKGKPTIEVNYDEFVFRPTGELLQGEATLYVTAENCDWTWRVVGEDGGTAEWIQIDDSNVETYAYLAITCSPNTGETERVGYIEVIPDTEELEVIRVRIVQNAVQDHVSDLTDDVDLSPVTKNARVVMMPLNDYEDRATEWQFRMWDDNIVYDETKWPPYVGTGEYIEFTLFSEKIVFNDASEYELPAATYTVTVIDPDTGGMGLEEENTITAGYTAPWNPEQCFGSWYYKIENDVVVAKAPIKAGTLIVERSGDGYVLMFDFEDDFGFSLSGRREGPLDITPQGVPMPQE